MNPWKNYTGKRRDRIGIIAEILEVAKHGALKTRIMYRANLSFVQLKEYLNFMLKTNLLKLSDRKTKGYMTTKKGISFVQKHLELAELLKDNEKSNGLKTPPRELLEKAYF